MGEVVNLRLVRKRAARKARESAADQNRIDSSIPASQRRKTGELRRIERERLEAKRIEKPRKDGN
jgi:hypothetical protein